MYVFFLEDVKFKPGEGLRPALDPASFGSDYLVTLGISFFFPVAFWYQHVATRFFVWGLVDFLFVCFFFCENKHIWNKKQWHGLRRCSTTCGNSKKCHGLCLFKLKYLIAYWHFQRKYHLSLCLCPMIYFLKGIWFLQCPIFFFFLCLSFVGVQAIRHGILIKYACDSNFQLFEMLLPY